MLPIFNNHLEKWGFFAAPSAFVAKIRKIEHALFSILEKDKLLIFTDALMDAIYEQRSTRLSEKFSSGPLVWYHGLK